MAFQIGQKVVRVDVGSDIASNGSSFLRGHRCCLTEVGQIYTIRAINVWPTKTLLRFHELDNSHLIGIAGTQIEPGFDSRGFRPLVEKKTETGMAILRKVAADASKRRELTVCGND